MEGMEVDGASPGIGGFFGGTELLGNLPFGAAPPPFGSLSGMSDGMVGMPPLRLAHGFMGDCRHGSCNCTCDCVCACECIVRQSTCCHCVPLEARMVSSSSGSRAAPPLPGGQLQRPGGSSNTQSQGDLFTFGLRDPPPAVSGSQVPGTQAPPAVVLSTPLSSGHALAAPAAVAAPAGPFGPASGASPFGGGSSPFGGLAGAGFVGLGDAAQLRKRASGDFGGSPFSLGASEPSIFGQPALKKCIRQTLDIRGNYRTVAVDAAEVMAD